MKAAAKKRFGQHFLQPAWAVKLLAAIDPRRSDVFIEIGPGRGALTFPLTAQSRHVVAFEIDRDLTAALRENPPSNLTIVQGDFLDVSADTIGQALRAAGVGGTDDVRVAGNLPYNVASPILFELVDFYRQGIRIQDATVMLQREVAARLLASPGTKEYGVLTILIGCWADIDRRLSLPPGAFRPVPKVHSAVVRLRFRQPHVKPANIDVFTRLVQAVFTRRRKTLLNALDAFPSTRVSREAALEAAGINGHRRPETLSIPEFIALSDQYAR